MFEEFPAELDEANVRFVVGGGLAVVIQGYARMTADIVDGARLASAVNAMDFADEEKRREWIETRSLQVFFDARRQEPLRAVDLFAREPIPFPDLWSRADIVSLGGRDIRAASIEDRTQSTSNSSRQSPGDAMATESTSPADSSAPDWRGDFQSAEERRLDLSLAATPSERLRWLEEALAFAARMRNHAPHG